MKAKRILTAAATVALVITSVFAGGNFTEVQAKDNDTPKKIILGSWRLLFRIPMLNGWNFSQVQIS